MMTALSTAHPAYGLEGPSASRTMDNATPQGSTYLRRNSVQSNGAGSQLWVAVETMDKLLLRIDLNLLRALYVLLQERNVTLAAERLFISQSGMSKSLQRLRELFDDPLLIRSRHGLVLSRRATDLVEPLGQIFTQIEGCIIPVRFDPTIVQERIHIASPEQFALVSTPQLLMRLCASAPNISVESLHLMDDNLDKLAAGTLDFVIDRDKNYPEGYRSRRICAATTMLWCRKEHPLAKKKVLVLKDIFSYPQISFRNQNVKQGEFCFIAREIAEAGLNFDKIILDTSHLMVALNMLAKMDCVMLGPDYLSRLPMLKDRFIAHPLDHISTFKHLSVDLALVQHERTLNSPLHQWITEQFVIALSTLGN